MYCQYIQTALSSVCGDILPLHPFFIYILLYIFSHISYTDIHIFTLCLYLYSLFAYLCVFYDLIHELIVYVHFRAIIFQWSNLYSVVYWHRVITFKAVLTEEGRVKFFCCLTYGESKTPLCQAVVSTVSIP